MCTRFTTSARCWRRKSSRIWARQNSMELPGIIRALRLSGSNMRWICAVASGRLCSALNRPSIGDKLGIHMRLLLLAALSAMLHAAGPGIVFDGAKGPGKGKHIVLIAADQEYRSEE